MSPLHLKHHPVPYHVNIPHLMVTTGMSGFSAWFVTNAASCNCLYPRWVNVLQASSWGVDTGRSRGKPEVKRFREKRGKQGTQCSSSQCKYCCEEERRLAGSLPARIELLVLTRTIHTPQRITGDTRAMVKARLIEHLHTFVQSPEYTCKASCRVCSSHLFTIFCLSLWSHKVLFYNAN